MGGGTPALVLRNLSAVHLALLVALAGCRKHEARPVARFEDAAIVVAPIDASAPRLRSSFALPVANIDGAYYYAVETQMDAPLGEARTWASTPAGDAVGVRAATKVPTPWSQLVGLRLDAYTADGKNCLVRVSGFALLDRASADAPLALARIEPESCVPLLVSSRGVPTPFAIADVPAAEAKPIKAAFAKEDRSAFPTGKSVMRESWMIALVGPKRFVLAVETAEQQTDCGTKQETVGVIYDGSNAVARLQNGERPVAALDVDGDGRPELFYGPAEWDHGMSGGKRFAAVSLDDGAGDVALSYYVGCD